MPARSTALICTKTSLEPSLGVMNPKPFWVLKNLTVPVAIAASLHRLLREMWTNSSSVRVDIRVFWDDLMSAQNRAALQGRTENLAARSQYAKCQVPSNQVQPTRASSAPQSVDRLVQRIVGAVVERANVFV